ncbi:MAG: ferritin [Clostridia bacterium]|nr:ferritin [Clostridia bacterium]
MTSKKVAKMLNEQINAELHSAYIYWDIAKYFECKGLKGFASWYEEQAKEEISHAKKIYGYMQNEGCYIKFEQISSLKEDITDDLSAAKLALKHEKDITALINNIYAQCYKDADYRTMKFLEWFIDEQAEEEDNAREVVTLIKLAGNSKSALYLADVKMGKRKAA